MYYDVSIILKSGIYPFKSDLLLNDIKIGWFAYTSPRYSSYIFSMQDYVVGRGVSTGVGVMEFSLQEVDFTGRIVCYPGQTKCDLAIEEKFFQLDCFRKLQSVSTLGLHLKFKYRGIFKFESMQIAGLPVDKKWGQVLLGLLYPLYMGRHIGA